MAPQTNACARRRCEGTSHAPISTRSRATSWPAIRFRHRRPRLRLPLPTASPRPLMSTTHRSAAHQRPRHVPRRHARCDHRQSDRHSWSTSSGCRGPRRRRYRRAVARFTTSRENRQQKKRDCDLYNSKSAAYSLVKKANGRTTSRLRPIAPTARARNAHRLAILGHRAARQL